MSTKTFESQLASLDIALFSRIDAQLTDDDKRSLLAVHHALREQIPGYVYLEIGSHLGGSIQPHLQDARCTRIISIDKRPTAVPDDRGYDVPYPGEFNGTYALAPAGHQPRCRRAHHMLRRGCFRYHA